MERESVIGSDPDILGGTPCFRGTGVSADSLIDYLEAGDTLDEFLDNFPSVTRECPAAPEEAKTRLTSREEDSHRREPAAQTNYISRRTLMLHGRRMRLVGESKTVSY